MNKIKLTGIVFLVFLVNMFAQDMRMNADQSLFSDQKASRLGDAVTIIVIESSVASNNATTSSGRTSNIGLNSSGTLNVTTLPSASLNVGSSNAFTGNGATRMTGLINTKISAAVDSVLANGNLHVSGSRKIVINGEEQLIRIKGIVRNSDILADNSVLSTNISEAEINFEGTGLISDSQKPGWITKFLHWVF
ncbi:MAG: flagellar basal body L-ring protein FlgH [Ignavibacteria bacterium]